jgi:hypothetical protein
VHASIKAELVYLKKEDIKSNEYISKLDEKMEDLENKNNEAEERYK